MRAVAALSLPLLLAVLAVAQKAAKDDGLVWTDATKLEVEGRGWPDMQPPYARLPEKAEKLVRKEVWSLSRHSAGLVVRFRTDAREVHAKWEVANKNLAMNHMPATGVSGVDLYVRHGEKWRWLGVGRPTAASNTQALVKGLPGATMREYLLYLPLYNGTKSLMVGVPRGAKLEKASARPAHKKPIVFYGTSIVHGGCASRPGMVHTAILGRRFDWPTINLGFSGNGKMELEIAKLLGEIDAAAYVLDCLPNMSAREVAERTEPFVLALRKLRPLVPIVLVEDRTYANADLLPGRAKGSEARRAALLAAYRKMESEGVVSLHYVPGANLIGDDGEGTVDGSHPTDLGFLRQADAMTPMMRYVLPGPDAPRAAIEGYTDQLSYAPGDNVQFQVSSSKERFTAEIARIGTERQVVWKKTTFSHGKHYPIPANASSHGCRWPRAFWVQVGKDWKSGYYVARLETELAPGKTASTEVFFVVRSATPGKTSKVLLQLSTNTYNAYTNWGGYSLYAYHGRGRVQGRRVSFDRPQSSQFRNWELPFVQWAEKAGYALDYASNCDLEHRPELLKHYKLVLSVGHDEYWSAPMRDHLEKYIAGGGNVAFFSGNTCCWQVRSEDRGRALVCFKQAYKADPLYAKGERKLLSTLWSHHLLGRPENALTGVGFLWGGYHRSHGQFMDGSGAFTVHRPDHWLLKGTNLKRGAAFGGKDTIVGYECDGCELVWKDGLPYPTHRDGTPKGFTVLATAPAKWHPDDCEWYEKWQKGRVGNAVIGVYQRGGTVVTVGTTDWSHGLRGGDAAVVRITKNVLERLGK